MAAALVVAGTLGVSPAASARASAAAPPVEHAASLPVIVSQYSMIVVDLAAKRVFISGGAQSDEIIVANLAGAVVGSIPVPGPAGLAMSPDGTTLYAALYNAGEIAFINTSTLKQTTAVHIPSAFPDYLAYTGGDVWFSAGITAGGQLNGQGEIGAVDPATGKILSTQPVSPYFYDGGLISASALDPGVLLAADNGEDPSTVYVYKVSNNKLQLQTESDAWGTDYCAFPNGLTIDPDRKDVLVGCLTPYRYSLTSYTADGSYPTGESALAVSSDGYVLFAGDYLTPQITFTLFAADAAAPSATYPENRLSSDENSVVAVAFGANHQSFYAVETTYNETSGTEENSQLSTWAPSTS
jgi:DNA-binding beta-propeller fold protein YncE